MPAASALWWTSKGRKSHQTVDDALSIVERLEHRAGKDAEGKTGDGVGILLQISHKFFSKVAEELTSGWATSGSTAWVCSSSPRTSTCGLRP